MNNKILATVNSNPITMQNVMDFIQSMGQQGAQYDNPQGHQLILEQLVSQQLLFLDAQKSGISFDAEYKAQLERAKKELLTSYAVNKLLSSVVATDTQCKEQFMKDPSAFTGKETVNASHILVDSQEKADDILAKIKAGDITFEEAAKESSSCPSSENGGNLGDFARGSMVKEFEDVAFNIAIDEISEPVKTQFGFHIIKVISKSEGSEVKYDDVKAQIMQQLTNDMRQKTLESKINQLKILYPVDIMSTDDKPKIIV